MDLWGTTQMRGSGVQKQVPIKRNDWRYLTMILLTPDAYLKNNSNIS